MLSFLLEARSEWRVSLGKASLSLVAKVATEKTQNPNQLLQHWDFFCEKPPRPLKARWNTFGVYTEYFHTVNSKLQVTGTNQVSTSENPDPNRVTILSGSNHIFSELANEI